MVISCDSWFFYFITLFSSIAFAASQAPIALQDARIIVYSNGPCLIVKRLLSDLITTVGDDTLKFHNESCSYNSNQWITAIDYFIDSSDYLQLIWADSKSSQVFTGILDVSGHKIVQIKPLPIGFEKGTFIRSLTFNRRQKVIYFSLPNQKAIAAYDLTGSNKTKLYERGEIGPLKWIEAYRSLFWIRNSTDFCRAFPDQHLIPSCFTYAIDNNDTLQSFTIDTEMHHIYLFLEHGKIIRTDLNRTNVQVISNNSLAIDKYSKALFYTAVMLKSTSGKRLKFYTSDALHQLFRITSFVSKGKNFRQTNYQLDSNNTVINFVDLPGLYDFLLLDPWISDRPVDPIFTKKPSWYRSDSLFNDSDSEEDELFESPPDFSESEIQLGILKITFFFLLVALFTVLMLLIIRKIITLLFKRLEQPSYWQVDSIKENLTDVKF